MVKPQEPDAAAVTIAILVLSFLVFLLLMSRDLGLFDEGIILSDAMRVLHGDVIHRDFYTNYGPGQSYVVAALFRISGDHFMVARLYDLVVKSVAVSMIFYSVIRACSLFISLMMTLAGILFFLSTGSALYPVFPCILLALISSYLVTRLEGRSTISPVLIGAGACAGLTAIFRYETGFFLLLANLAAIVCLIALSEHRGARGRRALAAMGVYVGGAAVVFAPVAILFLIASPARPFIADIVDYSTRYYALMRRLPFPGLQALWADKAAAAVYLPYAAVGLALVQLAPFAWSRLKSAPQTPRQGVAMAYLVAFGSTTALLSVAGMVRVSPDHMLMAIIPALVVFAVLIDLWWRDGGGPRLAALMLLLMVLAPPAIAARRELRRSYHAPGRSLAGWLALRSGLIGTQAEARATCETGPASGIARISFDYARVATYLDAYTRPDEPILAALDRHDRILMNPIALYFAAGRLPGTHWQQFDPGLQTRADIQRAIIGDLQRNHVRWVVRDASFDDVKEPNGSALSSGVRLLDRYLDQHYRRVAASGKVAIWLSNDQAPIAYRPLGGCEAAPAG